MVGLSVVLAVLMLFYFLVAFCFVCCVFFFLRGWFILRCRLLGPGW